MPANCFNMADYTNYEYMQYNDDSIKTFERFCPGFISPLEDPNLKPNPGYVWIGGNTGRLSTLVPGDYLFKISSVYFLLKPKDIHFFVKLGHDEQSVYLRSLEYNYGDLVYVLTVHDFAGVLGYWLASHKHEIGLPIDSAITAFTNFASDSFFQGDKNFARAISYNELDGFFTDHVFASIPEIMALNNTQKENDFYDLYALSRNCFRLLLVLNKYVNADSPR